MYGGVGLPSLRTARLPSNERQAPVLVGRASRGFAGAQIGFQQLPLSSKLYAALGAIDEEIYLRLRSIIGPAKAFALI